MAAATSIVATMLWFVLLNFIQPGDGSEPWMHHSLDAQVLIVLARHFLDCTACMLNSCTNP